jgi:hypothetical protein
MVHWLRLPEFADVPLCISRNRLIRYKTLPRAVGRWVMDSGGFTMIQQHGRWPMTAAEYVTEVRRIVDGVGKMPDWVAPMDNMCESQVIYGRRDVPRSSPQWFHGTRELRGLKPGDSEQDLATAVRIHQRLTVENYLQLLELAPEIPWMPVLQGATLASYIECANQYEDASVDLGAKPIVGLGSVCRRQDTSEIGAIVSIFADRGWLLHGFGVKSAGITKYGHMLASADSLAWSTGARRAPRMAGCTHRAERCQNCARYALRWRSRVIGTLPGWRQLSLLDGPDAPAEASPVSWSAGLPRPPPCRAFTPELIIVIELFMSEWLAPGRHPNHSRPRSLACAALHPLPPRARPRRSRRTVSGSTVVRVRSTWRERQHQHASVRRRRRGPARLRGGRIHSGDWRQPQRACRRDSAGQLRRSPGAAPQHPHPRLPHPPQDPRRGRLTDLHRVHSGGRQPHT